MPCLYYEPETDLKFSANLKTLKHRFGARRIYCLKHMLSLFSFDYRLTKYYCYADL